MTLLFDLDGTLSDPFTGIANSFIYALEKLGQPLPDPAELKWCIGPPMPESFKKLLDTDNDDEARNAVLISREYFTTVGMFENELYQHIPQILAELKEHGHQLIIATSKPRVFAEKILAHFEIDHFFTAIHGAELDGTRADKTELISYILQRHEIPADEAVMIGDRKHDIIGATNNNIKSIGVSWGYGSIDELTASQANQIAQSPQHLCQLIDAI
ncbi:HAD family hydrolase [Persicirhabdus sediminis]|uniref:HAD family hydrolase n=1 Tax=Persicirhabdus sediminis TaxID=454144 RepID=A0A8J7MDF2_9BACT|nr:HAD family hydrolase [Persicirhabdus sediminis]MBK1791739.1 HAD family hydrolase [Persicirhabdus sediminis]